VDSEAIEGSIETVTDRWFTVHVLLKRLNKPHYSIYKYIQIYFVNEVSHNEQRRGLSCLYHVHAH